MALKHLCIFLCLAAAVQSAKVTPMEKVIGLLKGLSSKVEAEGKKEAAQYDKFACFCKEQADEKQYNIEKSQDKIADLKAEIKELEADIARLNLEIGGLSKKITGLEGEIKDKTEASDKRNAAYNVKAKDHNEAIDACAAAIDALKDSKGAMSDAKLNLVQVASAKLNLASGAAELLSKVKAAPKFTYQSNDIIATLEDLLASFKEMKKDLDIEEFDANSAFEKTRLGLQNEKKFAEKDRSEKESIVEEKTEANEAAKSDRDEESNDMGADQEFLSELTNQCEEKATQFDQRSSTRADEITALSKATEELEKGAVPNFSANKKLVGLSQKKVVLGNAASFVQVASVQHQRSGQDAVIQRVRDALEEAGRRTGSGAISALAVRVTLAADHFVKVRGLIKDLITKLNDDAKEEATQKGFCDKGMNKAISDRDEANAKIEVCNAKITTLTAKQSMLEDEISTLRDQIAGLKKELLEATELRNDDKAENAETIKMAGDGIDSVDAALKLLQNFYNNAFIQKKYTPPQADRSGNTVGDLAPETFADEDYHGSQAESKGIVGIMEVILSDFQRTKKQAEDDEKDSKKNFEEMEKDSNADVDKKNKRINKAEGEVDGAKADLLAEGQALSEAKDLLDSAASALEGLEAMCVKGEETWEERAAARKEEINALKDAIVILDEWQN